MLEVEDGAGGIDPQLADRLFEQGSAASPSQDTVSGSPGAQDPGCPAGEITIEATTQGSCVVCYIPKEV